MLKYPKSLPPCRVGLVISLPGRVIPKTIIKLPPCMARNALGLEFGSAARLSKRPGRVWNCLWGHALKRSPGINHKSRVSYPGPAFLYGATWPSLLKLEPAIFPLSQHVIRFHELPADTNQRFLE